MNADVHDLDNTAENPPEFYLDERGVIQRHWVTREGWETLQLNLISIRTWVFRLLGLMGVIAICMCVFPKGQFWRLGGAFLLLEAYLAFVTGQQVWGLVSLRRTMHNLRPDELTVLTSDIRTRSPGLMRTLQAWAHSNIPLTNLDENILREAIAHMEENAHEYTIAGLGFGAGQRADPTLQTIPYSEDDVSLIMPWETSGHQQLAG